MDRIEFTENLKIDVNDIDTQHRGFFEIYNEFVDHYNNNDVSLTYLAKVFNNLFLYTKYHFREEEWIMKTTDFLGGRDHIEEHGIIIENLTLMRNKAKTNIDYINMMTMFMNMWIDHITVMDVELGIFLKQRSSPMTRYYADK